LNALKYGDTSDFDDIVEYSINLTSAMDSGVGPPGLREPGYEAAVRAVAALIDEQTPETWSAAAKEVAALAAVALVASKVILVNNFANVQLQDAMQGGCRFIVADYPEPKTPIPGRFFRP
jgi:hypothetical protein